MKAAHKIRLACIVALLAIACEEEISQAPPGLVDPQAAKPSARAALETKPADAPAASPSSNCSSSSPSLEF